MASVGGSPAAAGSGATTPLAAAVATAQNTPGAYAQATPLIIPAVPDSGVLTSTLALGTSGLVETITDIYRHMGRLAERMMQHESSQGLNHDLLEVAMNAQDAMIAAMEARENAHEVEIKRLLTKMSEAENAVYELRVESKLTRELAKHKADTTLARDERCRTLGNLGDKAEFLKWTVTVEQICAERFPGSRKCLASAKAAGDSRVPEEAITGLTDPEQAEQFIEELYGLLQQQTSGSVWLAVYNLKQRGLNGLEAWREIHYGCNPKNSLRAEELREQVVKALPEGRAKNMADLKSKLVTMDAKIRAHDEVSNVPMEEQIKLMGLKAVLPLELKARWESQTDIADNYTAVFKWVESLCARHTASGAPHAGGGNFQVPMQLGAVGDASSSSEVTQALANLTSVVTEAMGTLSQVGNRSQASPNNFNLRAQGGGKAGGKAGGKGGDRACFACGQTGHVKANCPNLPQGKGDTPWRRREAARDGAQKGAGGKGGQARYNQSNATLLCRHYARTGTCPYGQACKFRHSRGAQNGALAQLAEYAEDVGRQLTFASLGDSIKWDAGGQDWVISPEVELDVCAEMLAGMGCATEEDVADFRSCIMEEQAELQRQQQNQGFQGQRRE